MKRWAENYKFCFPLPLLSVKLMLVFLSPASFRGTCHFYCILYS
ncbi:hypothetical protein SLEP1_g24758 [Rubroshorea leprosula]|uniref:Uncharacterized protein n=1 Tax=Rubroshorea leprosula TaxID=152421 RepID=A0AAV5JGN3_9ROSI|nr:hypothetical protein SLEP1_g24758 [Rubroshorea leprosula]